MSDPVPDKDVRPGKYVSHGGHREVIGGMADRALILDGNFPRAGRGLPVRIADIRDQTSNDLERDGWGLVAVSSAMHWLGSSAGRRVPSSHSPYPILYRKGVRK